MNSNKEQLGGNISTDIAIIGMAGRFPGAANIRELYKVLRDGKDCVRQISKERIIDSTIPLGPRRYRTMGWIPDIDKFDHKFFGISPREAEHMDPHQRFMLEVAYEVLESSAYPLEHFRGSKTAIMSTCHSSTYQRYFDQHAPTIVVGNMRFCAAGRVARHFDLRGPALFIDTGCSAGLEAVHMACDQLLLGSADYAMAIASQLNLEPMDEALEFDLGTESRDGKTRSFSDGSTGSGLSEAVVGVLLKPLKKALEDGDIIYAVIKAAASNSSAQLAGSLTATSSAAQAEAIAEAWCKGNVAAESISFIEAHGSGTELGDPIEISGIDLAFQKYTSRKGFCAVSCVKTNIGHTDKAAGLCGLVKVVLSLQNKQLFPSLHFDPPNPHIDFENSATFINTKLTEWKLGENKTRRAGVSSFGFSGSNVHVVLEEAPSEVTRPAEVVTGNQQIFLITVSSKRAAGVMENINLLAAYLNENESISIQDISVTLKSGRSHYKHRVAFLVKNRDELDRALTEYKANEEREVHAYPEINSICFIFSDLDHIAPGTMEEYSCKYDMFARCWTKCKSFCPAEKFNTGFLNFAFQYCLFNLLREQGIKADNVVGIGLGNITAKVITGEMELQEGVTSALAYVKEEAKDLDRRARAFLERQQDQGRVGFLEMGPLGNFSSVLAFQRSSGGNCAYEVETLDMSRQEGILELVKRLYEKNYPINWQKFCEHENGKRVWLPGYSFEKIRSWNRKPHAENDYNEWAQKVGNVTSEDRPQRGPAVPLQTEPIAPLRESWSSTEQEVASIWMQVLGLKSVELDDDFFKLGGHSLFGTMVSTRIERKFGIEFEIQNIFAFSTIKSLAIEVEKLRRKNGRLTASANGAVTKFEPLPPAEYYPVSSNQFRLWLIHELDGAGLAYNLPFAFHITGQIEPGRLEKAIQKIADRHEVMRSSFHRVGADVVQKVHPQLRMKLSLIQSTQQPARQMVSELVRPFNLKEAPLMRFFLLKISDNEHILVVDSHHIIFDATSMIIFSRELLTFCGGGELPPLDIQFKEYASWQRKVFASEAGRQQETYWLERFAKPPPLLDLPTDFPRNGERNHEGRKLHIAFGSTRTREIKQFAQNHNVTLFMVLIAGYSVLLSKYSGQEDIVIGTPIAGRSELECENLIGMFVNTLAIRTYPEKAKEFNRFLSEVKEDCMNAYKHQAYPFEELVKQLKVPRSPEHHPIFDTMLLMQNIDLKMEVPTGQPIQIRNYGAENNSAKFDLAFEFVEINDELTLAVEYKTALFKESSIARLGTDMKAILDKVICSEDIKISDIELGHDRVDIGTEITDFEFGGL